MSRSEVCRSVRGRAARGPAARLWRRSDGTERAAAPPASKLSAEPRRPARHSSTTRACRPRGSSRARPVTCPSAPSPPTRHRPRPAGAAGRAHMDLPGFRNAPSLMYARSRRRSSWTTARRPAASSATDGASSLEVQAQQPFITPFEMANGTPRRSMTRLQASPATLALFSDRLRRAGARRPGCRPGGHRAAPSPPTRPRIRISSVQQQVRLLAGRRPRCTARAERAGAVQQPRQDGNCNACHHDEPGRATARTRSSPTSLTTTSACRVTGTSPANAATQ